MKMAKRQKAKKISKKQDIEIEDLTEINYSPRPQKIEGPIINKLEQDPADGCQLQCTKEKKQVDYVEYVGPVHISLIDPPGYVYRKTMVETALLNLAYFLIGATVMFTLYYTLLIKHHWAMNLHILLGTLGSQIFMPIFFLTLNPLDGAGIFGKSKDKRKSACIVNLVGVFCIWTATASLALYWDYFVTNFSMHSGTGFAATVCCFLNFTNCCCILADEDSTLGRFVQLICVPAYVLSTATFISGMFQPTMIQWYPEKHMPTVLAVLCVIYTLIIIYRPVKNYLVLV